MALLLAPALVAALALVLVGPMSRRLPPRTAAWLTAGSISAVFVSVLTSAWIVSLGLLSGAPFVHALFTWCLHPMSHAGAGIRALGAVALAASAVLTLHACRVTSAWWGSRADGAAGVRVVKDQRPLAYVEAGRGGAIIVSTGMLGALAPDERQAMLAHETAHLRHRHDRFLAVGQLVGSLPGVGRRVVGHLHFALERWADEEAARAVGSREVVAHAVARAAIAQHETPAGALGMAGGDIVGRVEFLLDASKQRHVPALAVFGAVVAAAAVQLHHLPEILRMVC